MKSTTKAVITEGYDHSLDAGTKQHGTALFNETFGKIKIGGARVVVSPLPFLVIGCTEGDALGLGWGSVQASGKITRSTGTQALLDEDEGLCSGKLISPTRGVLPCNCTMKLMAVGTASSAATPAGDRKPAEARPTAEEARADTAQPLKGEVRIIGIDSKPVPSVLLRFTSNDGQEQVLKTDENGIAKLDGLPFVPRQMTAGEDPRNWSPYGLPNPLATTGFDLDSFLMTTYGKSQQQFRGVGSNKEKETFGAALVARADAIIPWVGPALLGEFNNNPTIGQIVFDTVVTMFPYADQVGDVRDLVAVLLRMSEPGEISDFFNWVTLATCVVGAVPTIGSALRGGYKVFLRDYLKAGSRFGDGARRTLEHVLDAMRALGIGDPRAVLKTSARELSDLVIAAYRKLVDRLDTVLRFIIANASAAARRFAERLRRMVPLPQAEQRIRAAVKWLHENVLAVLNAKQADEAWDASVMQVAASERKVRNAGRTVPNAIQTFGKPALRLTADEWRQASHAIFRHALKDRSVEHTFVYKKVTYTVWHSESGMIFGTYQDLNKLKDYVKELHVQRGEIARLKRGEVADVTGTYDLFRDTYINSTTGKAYDRRVEGFQHHHIVDDKDLAELYVKPGAQIIPLEGDASLFVRSEKEMEEIYDQLPCVTIHIDRHRGKNSLSSLAQINRAYVGKVSHSYDNVADLKVTYTDFYRDILEPAEARDTKAVLDAFVQFISEAR